MSRSRVLSGRHKQLDRAKQRGRLDHRKGGASARDDDQALKSYLKTRFATGTEIAEIERIDLREFLSQTSGFDIPSAERLRQLAIFLEDAAQASQPRGWLSLARIYEEAEQLAENVDDRTDVLTSVAIAAHYTAESVADDELETARRLWNVAYAAIHRAIEADPLWSKSHSVLAQMRYRDPEGDLEEGLADCGRALAQDAGNGWAQYHRAFILRDLERYKDAAAAFDEVNLAFFTRDQSDRQEQILEARAYCLLRAGERERAISEFQDLLSRYERSPSLARKAYWWDLVEVATGELAEPLGVRAKALVQRYADYMNDDFADIDDSVPFVENVQFLLTGLVEEQQPERVGLIKIDHWFSPKWREFVGKVLGAAGVHRKATNRIPPFHPNRVVSELQYRLNEKRRYEALRNPPRIHVYQSDAFANERAFNEAEAPSVWLWYSGRSREEDRASIMAYVIVGKDCIESFYVEYSKTGDREWKASKLIGIGSERLRTLASAGASTEEYYPWEW